MAAASVVLLLLVPLLDLVACSWRPGSAPRPSPEGFRSVTFWDDQKDRNPEPEAPVLPSTVTALHQLARARGVTTAGGRRVSKARKADLLMALAGGSVLGGHEGSQLLKNIHPLQKDLWRHISLSPIISPANLVKVVHEPLIIRGDYGRASKYASLRPLNLLLLGL